MSPAHRALLEREHELTMIDAALADAATGHGTVTVVHGAAGIGKTRLLAAARARAATGTMEVRAARGSDLEREFQWGVVRQLLVGDEPLDGPAKLARPVLRPHESAGGADATDEGAVLHGLYWFCAGRAQRGPLLVCVDDAHWADVPSLRFLAYLAARVEGLPVALVLGVRAGEEPELVIDLMASSEVVVVRPRALSGDAARALLAADLGQAPDAGFVDACQAATHGNPYLLQALARAARDEGMSPDAAGAVAVADLGPRSVARAILRRAGALAPGAVDLARAVAVLGPDAELRHAAALAGLGVPDAGRAADALAEAAILADARPLDFVHPLTRAAIAGDMSRTVRSALHAAAARTLLAEEASPGRVAAHLAHTEPDGDERVVAILRAAAADAMATGAPSSAAAHLRRALAEPPAREELSDVLRELGGAEAVDGLATGFDEHLERAIDTSRTPDQRAAAALDLARAFATVGDFSRTGRTCLAVLDGLDGDTATVLVDRLRAELIQAALNEFSLAEAVAPLRRAQVRRLYEEGVEDVELLAALGLVLVSGSAPASRGAAIARRAAGRGVPPANSSQAGSIGNALLWSGCLEEARDWYARVQAEGERRGATAWLGFGASFRSRATLELGEVRRAEEEAQYALDLFERRRETGLHQHHMHRANLAFALVERACLPMAVEVLDRRAVREGRTASFAEAQVRGAYARALLALGEPDRALHHALAAGDAPMDRATPAALSWRSDAARALAVLGRREEAQALAAHELRIARGFAVPHAVSRALRASAFAEPDLDAAARLLEEALRTVEATAAGFERMAAHVELGAVLRRAGQRSAAVEHLRLGLDLAHRGGATALAERAHGDLLTAGVRPRRAVMSGVDALTPAERRVVDLAARGSTNQEIAQTLFVTTRTVEAHLTRAFRKLDVTSRTELPAALADPDR